MHNPRKKRQWSPSLVGDLHGGTQQVIFPQVRVTRGEGQLFHPSRRFYLTLCVTYSEHPVNTDPDPGLFKK